MNITIKSIFYALATAMLIASCSAEPAPSADGPQGSAEHPRRSAIIPGIITVQVSEELAEELASGTLQTKSADVNSAFGRLGVTKVERVYPDAGEWEPRHRAAGLHRWFRIEFDPDSVPSTKAAEDISDIPGIVYAEPERRIRSTAYFNDPRESAQWALYNHGLPEGMYADGVDVNVQPVWDCFTAGTPNVIVAVLDEGMQLDHQDLAASTIPAGPEGSQSFIYGRTGPNIPVGNHGTHVAGIIGAINNNGVGISSIAGGYDGKGGVKLMSLAILMEDPDDPEKTVGGYSNNAFVWAADHGALIANNSWSYVYDTEEEDMHGSVGEKMATAINYFIKYAGCDVNGNQKPDSPMKGGLVLFAAGNEQYQIGWPAAFDPVIAVGAIASNGQRAYYSNYGNWVDICAPGGDLKLGPGILSSVSGNEYASYQGTSMACPMVSGVAALLVSHYGGPGFTVNMLKDRLMKGANSAKGGAFIGPLVDAMGSFTYGGTIAPEPVTDLEASASANTVTMKWSVTPDKDDVKAYGYIMLIGENKSVLESFQGGFMVGHGLITKEIQSGRLNPGEPITGSIGGLEFTKEYYAAVAAYDYRGHYSVISNIVQVETGENNPPVIIPENPGEYVFKAFQKIYLKFTVSDPDGHKITLTSDGGSKAFTMTRAAEVINVTLKGSDAPAGKYTATITATDQYGASSSYSFDYEILQNHPPVLIKNPDDLIFDGTKQSTVIKISDYIFDEDEEPLEFELSSSEDNIAEVKPNGDDVKIASKGYGVATAKIVASDISGTSCTLEFRVLVRDPSLDVEIFPNPVKSTLYIRPKEAGTLSASVTNKAGAEIYSGSAEVTPFEPLAIDMSKQASGTYYVRLKGCGLDGRYTIAKI